MRIIFFLDSFARRIGTTDGLMAVGGALPRPGRRYRQWYNCGPARSDSGPEQEERIVVAADSLIFRVRLR
jgi:hypothetical protein